MPFRVWVRTLTSLRTRFVLPLVLVTAFGLAGCAEDYPPEGYVVVESSPPPERVEVIGVAPGPDHVFLPGHWVYARGTYVWVGGRWAVRPHARAVYVRGHWVRTRRGWFWAEGGWR